MKSPTKAPWWEELFTKNPMMAEVTRFRKRFLSFRGSSVAINGGIGVVLVCYAIFAIACVNYRGDLDPLLLIMFFLWIMLFAIPLLLHASIAGERERRSWDMLLVAPITHGQIVVGKFMGAFAGLSMAFGLYMIPVLVDALFNPDTQFVNVVLACLTVLAQGASLIAMTLLISARVKRPLIALGVSIGVIMMYFIFLPVFVGSLSTFFGNFLTGILSPNFVILQLQSSQMREIVRPDENFAFQDMNKYAVTFSHLAYQTIVTVAFLGWAIKTLVFADNEVKFIPKSKANARSKKSA